jgi:hypothetical protein
MVIVTTYNNLLAARGDLVEDMLLGVPFKIIKTSRALTANP